MKADSTQPADADPATRAAASGPSTVRKLLDAQTVLLEPHGTAGLAVPGYTPAAGDRVVCLVDEQGAAWVVGVLSTAPAKEPTPMLDAAVSEPRGAEALTAPLTSGSARVHDKRGRLLFEYDPGRDVAVLHAAAGDLEIVVPEGALRIQARDGVDVQTAGTLSLQASRELSLEASRGEGPAARLRMQPGEMALTSAVLSVAADRAEVLASRLQVHAHRLESQVERAKHVVKVVEVRAGRIVERARDVYREVEGLSQTRAGRLKLVAKKTAQFVGENTLIKARDRMKVKGERIHLA